MTRPSDIPQWAWDGAEIIADKLGTGYILREIEIYARALVAAEARGMEKAAEAVDAERLHDPSDSEGDIAYGRAIDDAISAIRQAAKEMEQ